MRYIAMACDYDGTLAHHGQVDESSLAALGRLRDSGRRLVLVTGRQLDELQTVFPRVQVFDRVVAENGALVFDPKSREVRTLAEPPSSAFIEQLRDRGVAPLSSGRVIVATWRPHELHVLETIRDLGLELQVIFNKDAVMVLPPGVNKATGLAAALTDLRLSPHNVVAVGDAENDHALLQYCECGVAVANALPMLKERADLVTAGDHGFGVTEVVDRLIADDLAEVEPALTRRHIRVGLGGDGEEVRVPPYGRSILLAGPSGGGKSTLTSVLLERLAEHEYQFCLVDPEGDYEAFERGVVLGTGRTVPDVSEVLSVLETPAQNAIVNLTSIPLDERPRFFEQLLPRLQEMRSATGRPHWIVLDEAHHLVPSEWHASRGLLPQRLRNVLLVTLAPRMVAREVLESVDALLVLGEEAASGIEDFVEAVGDERRSVKLRALERGEAALWWRRGESARSFTVDRPKNAHRRHRRKYAEGELIDVERFAFRGPDGKLNLHAENLRVFIKIADGVDEETWLHHLRRGDYSRWFRDVIKDEELAAEAQEVEREQLPVVESRARIREIVERRYAV